ncbi:hypothetical protein V8B97DRAFT_2022173 [Scleroderma yunnanense]
MPHTNHFTSCSPLPLHPTHEGDHTDDGALSDVGRAHCHSDKRRAEQSPSLCHSPSHDTCHKKQSCRDPSLDCLLLHQADEHCLSCHQYQQHIFMDLVMEMPNIMQAHEDCLAVLFNVLNYNNKYITLKHELSSMKDELASMHHDHDYWHEKACISTDSLHCREAADLEQACLLSMNAPLAHPINTPGAGSSLWPLQDCLLSSGGGSGESHSHSHSSPQETLLNPNLMQVNIIEPHPELHPRPIPNPLEGSNVYQFENPCREDVLRNIRLGIAPPVHGAIPPGAMCLINTLPKFKELYDLVKKKVELNDENSFSHMRRGQKLIAWLNRYMADTDHQTGAKLFKNPIILYALSHSPHPLMHPEKSTVQVGPSQCPHQAALPPIINNQKAWSTNKQDSMPKGAPGWGAPIGEWRAFIHCQWHEGNVKKFAGVANPGNPTMSKPPSD